MRDRTSRSLASGLPALARRCRPLLALALALAGCRHLVPPPCSGEAADLAVPGRRDLHVRLALTREGSTRRYEVALQVEPGRVTAIGLTPMGTPAFRVTHDADGVESDNGIGRFLGYAPRRAYDAIANALLARPDPDAPPRSALVTTGPDGIRIENPRCGYSARLVVISDERA